MIGNVIADNLNIYRSGFSDAFALIFKRFLEFKFDLFPGIDPRGANQGQLRVSTISGVSKLMEADDLRGHLWEPALQEGGLISVNFDSNHALNSFPVEDRFGILLLALGSEEMHTFNTEHKEFLENFRFRVSSKIKKIRDERDN